MYWCVDNKPLFVEALSHREQYFIIFEKYIQLINGTKRVIFIYYVLNFVYYEQIIAIESGKRLVLWAQLKRTILNIYYIIYYFILQKGGFLVYNMREQKHLKGE